MITVDYNIFKSFTLTFETKTPLYAAMHAMHTPVIRTNSIDFCVCDDQLILTTHTQSVLLFVVRLLFFSIIISRPHMHYSRTRKGDIFLHRRGAIRN